jgi:hypothetical protein
MTSVIPDDRVKFHSLALAATGKRDSLPENWLAPAGGGALH